MKFRDGMWLVAEGVRPEYAEEIYSVNEREDGKGLSLLCPTKKMRERSDSLNLATLTIVSMACHPGDVELTNSSRTLQHHLMELYLWRQRIGWEH